MSTNRHPEQRRKLPMIIIGWAVAVLPLSACSSVEKGWKSTTGAITGLFSDDDEKAAPPPADEQTAADAPAEPSPSPAPTTGGGGLFMGSSPASSAFRSSAEAPPGLSSVPTTAPTPPSAEAKPKKTVEGLVADSSKAEYTEQGGRQEPVTVRPLNDNPSAADSSSGGPPRPQAAPTERVTRLAETPASPSTPGTEPAVAPRTTALAERLGAAPPPPPVASSANAPMAPAVSTAPAPAPVSATPAAAPISPRLPVQPLIPAASSIASYGDETIVVDGSGVRGGRGILNTQQMAAVPRSTFDPGNASVSSEVGTISFAAGSANLSAQAKAVLADVAKLRAQVDGAIRIVGRGDQASARAASISRELRRLGVPSARLYDGGADSTLLGDEADIYLDY